MENTNSGFPDTFKLGGDLSVRRLGFGAMRLTGPGVWGWPKDITEARRVLRRVTELGINFIDTADSYGPEVAELLIADALYPYPSGLVIATKGGFIRTGPNQWITNGNPQYLTAACEASLRRLRLGESICINITPSIRAFRLKNPSEHSPTYAELAR